MSYGIVKYKMILDATATGTESYALYIVAPDGRRFILYVTEQDYYKAELDKEYVEEL